MRYRTAEALKKDHCEVAEKYRQKVSWGISDPLIAQRMRGYIMPDAEILDVGSASGAGAESLRKAGYRHVAGIDFDDYRMPGSLGYMTSFKIVDLNNSPIPHADESFDAVIAFAVLEHLENAFHCLREATRVLRQGGILIMSLPNIYRISSGLNLMVGRHVQGYHAGNDHIMILSKEILGKAFQGRLKIIETVYSPGFARIPIIRQKLRMPRGRLFSTKVCYILRKVA